LLSQYERSTISWELRCRNLDLEVSEGFVLHNLGYLSTLGGDISGALGYERAETRFRALGSQLGPLLIDRGEILLSPRLLTEAREARPGDGPGLPVRATRHHAA
jgi:hypothetical protein